MILSKLCIYVENLDDFVELQQYLFTQDITWAGNSKKLFRNWTQSTSPLSVDNLEISFPRNLMIGSNKNMFNGGFNDDNRLKNEFNLKEVNGKKILRKLKLKKLNEKGFLF